MLQRRIGIPDNDECCEEAFEDRECFPVFGSASDE